MGLTLQNLRDQLRSHLGMDDQDLTDSIVDNFLNLSYWEITKKLNFREVEQEVDLTLVIGTRTYLLASVISDFDSIRHVTIQNIDNLDWRELFQTDYDNILNVMTDNVSEYGVPERYARDNANIVFNPAPDLAYIVKLRYRESLGDLLSSGPGIPEEFHEIILMGGVHRAWRSKGFANRANDAMNYQISLIATVIDIPTKENRDYSMASASIVRRRYP